MIRKLSQKKCVMCHEWVSRIFLPFWAYKRNFSLIKCIPKWMLPAPSFLILGNYFKYGKKWKCFSKRNFKYKCTWRYNWIWAHLSLVFLSLPSFFLLIFLLVIFSFFFILFRSTRIQGIQRNSRTKWGKVIRRRPFWR